MNLQRFFGAIALVVVAIFFVAACSPSPPEPPSAQAKESVAQEDGEHHMEEGEHHMEGMDHVHAEVPHEYEEVINPFAGNTEMVEAGEVVFETNCATCHGPEGHGDGPASTGLNPKPANLADSQMMGELSDAYLFWRVSEGGAIEPFNSAMPAWKETLSEEQRWQVVNYLRTLDKEDEPHADADHHEADDHHAEEEHEEHHEEEHHEEEGEHHEED